VSVRGAGAALVLTAIMATVAAAAVPAPAAGAEKAIWGPLELPNGRNAFPLYRRLGVDTFQIQLDFARAAPTPPAEPTDPADPAYRWPAEIDRAIDQAGRRGIRVAILVNRSPSWANGGNAPTWAPRPRHFARFLTAAARRYPIVRRWMVWGEPNKSDRFQPAGPSRRSAPRAYARVLDAAYGALKRESPMNVVIGGMTWTGGDIRPAQFLRWLRLPNGKRPRLDWYGHNPFPFRFPRLSLEPLSGGWRDISDMDLFGREVARAFPGRPRLWLSEFTIQSDQRSSIFELHVTRRQQARWLTAAYRIADRLRFVAGLGWIGLVDQAPGPGSSHWGLMTHDGTPKPALRAYRKAPGGS
jgi:hypothetical protein